MIPTRKAAITIAALPLAIGAPALGQTCSGFWNNEMTSRSTPAWWGKTLLVNDDGHGPAVFFGGFWKWDFHKWVSVPNRQGYGPFVVDDPDGPRIYAYSSTNVEHGLFKWDGEQMIPDKTWLYEPYCELWQVTHPFHAIEGTSREWFARGYYPVCHGGFYRVDLLRWDGSTWVHTDTGLDVITMTSFNGEIYVAGEPDYQCSGGAHVARRRADNIVEWIAEVNWDQCGGSISDMITFDDGTGPALYIAGRFRTLNGEPMKSIAKWNGFEWAPVGVGLEDDVADLEVWRHDGVEELLAVGAIANAGNEPAQNIAVWNGTRWRSFGSGADQRIAKAAVVDLPWRQSIFFAGEFETIGGLYSPEFAEWVCYECRANCDDSTGQGVLDIFDFLCFQDAFVNEEAYACDCDMTTGPGVCDIFDFICFQDAFVAGCP